jgi:hypothetical protein
MSNQRLKEMNNEELGKEYRKLIKKLEKLIEQKRNFQESIKSDKYWKIIERIDKEIYRIRQCQKEICKEWLKR